MCGSLPQSLGGEASKIGPSKNKFEKSGMFFNAKIRAVKNHENALIHRVMTIKKPSKTPPHFQDPLQERP
jgi:hypothetical protein